MSHDQTNHLRAPQQDNDVIDLGKLYGLLLDSRWFIIGLTSLFAIIGIAYALLATPIYKTDALVQVEEKSSGMPALSNDMADLFSQESPATTEIEILKSRMVLGQTVDNLNLTTIANPVHMPVIGKGLARLSGEVQYIAIGRFELDENLEPQAYLLRVADAAQGQYQLFDQNDNLVLEGEVGKLATNQGITLFITQIQAQDGAEFSLSKISRLDAIQNLQNNLSVAERGKQTGILQLSLTGENRAKIQKILNDVTQNYLMQNVARNSAEAENSLVFLKKHLPEIKAQLTSAEDKLNQFRQTNESVDLNLEAKSTLDVMVSLEAQLNELTFKESDISQLYTKNHPAYQSLLEKRQQLLTEKGKLNKRIEKLPKVQREVLRMTRDVEVNQQIYIQLLNKVQELNIVKASTVGNVRIIDSAQAYTAPVKPKKPLIVVLATLLGGMLAVAIVLLKAAMRRGIQTAEEVEAIGIPVYASLPRSPVQIKITQAMKKRELPLKQSLLVLAEPTDLSIEALRSMRTSLHFATMEAANNVVMITGPAPSLGKSFVSGNLAAVIAQSGQKILVINGDLRKGITHSDFKASGQTGLSEYLNGQSSIQDVIQATPIDGLDCVARGKVPPNPSELLMHARFGELLEWAKKEYDLVLIDTPPILAVTDAAIIGKHAATTFMVGRYQQTSVKEIEAARTRLEQNGILVKGFIINDIEDSAAAYYGGYGFYHYEYKA